MEHVNLGFRLLGPLAVTKDGNAVSPGRGRAAVLLAVLLLAAGRSVSAESLMADVWDERTPTKNTLHGTVNEVRSLLEKHGFGPRKQVLRHEASNYRLVVPDESVDLRVFRRRVAEARDAGKSGQRERAFAALTEALELWHGDPLGGLESRRLDNFRTGMVEEHHQVALRRAELGLELGQENELLGDLFELTRRYPEDQEAARHLMLALHRRGRTTEALSTWRTLHRRIDAREGISLSPATNELYRRILDEDPALRPRPTRSAHPRERVSLSPGTATGFPVEESKSGSKPPGPEPDTKASAPSSVSEPSTPTATGVLVRDGTRDRLTLSVLPTAPLSPSEVPLPSFTLPRDVRDFVGRETELARIHASAQERDSAERVWVISGMPGVGKTALATRAAHRLRRRFLDAALFVRLNGHGPRRQPREAAEVLHELLRDIGVAAESIPDRLDSRAALWRRRTEHKYMILFLDNAASAEQVRPLLPDGRHCFVLVTSRTRLTGLEGVRQLTLDPLPHSEAVELFARRAGVDRETTPGKPLDTVVSRTGRLPLALHLLAARLHEHSSWSLDDLTRLLRDSPDLVAEIRGGADDLSAFFDNAVEALQPEEYRAFLLLGLHAGTEFSLSSAEALLDCSTALADRLIEALLRHYLIQEDKAGQYRHHDLLGVYARQQVERKMTQDERRAAVQRLLDRYLVRAESADRKLHPWRRRLDIGISDGQPGQSEPPNRERIWTTTTARDRLRGEWEQYERVGPLAREYGFATYEAHLAHVLAEYLYSEGFWEIASRMHMQAVHVWHEEKDRSRHAHALVELSRVLRQRGVLDAAHRTASDALRQFRALGEAVGEADALNQLGSVYHIQSDCKKALKHHNEAHSIYQKAKDRNGVATALIYGNASRIPLGMYDETLQSSDDAISIFRKLRNKAGEISALNTKGQVLHIKKQRKESRDIFEGLLHALADLHKKREASHVLNNIGEIELEEENPIRAKEFFGSALQLMEETNELHNRNLVRCNMARAELLSGAAERALRIYQETLSLIDNGSLPDSGNPRVLILQGIGDVHLAQQDYTTAADSYQRAADLARERKMPADEARSLLLLGDSTIHTHGLLSAQRHWERSLEIYAHIGHPDRDVVKRRIQQHRQDVG